LSAVNCCHGVRCCRHPDGGRAGTSIEVEMAKGNWAVAALCLHSATAAAQQPPPPPPSQQEQAPQGMTWAQLPRMELERQFAGPLQDTIIQRWRDPVDGTVCYIYLPITAQHSTPGQSGFVQYGSNVIGSISCVGGAAASGSAAKKSKR
jgi:hypothetical protein